MSERPQNGWSARFADRTHNSRRHRAEDRPDEPQSAGRIYRGGHHSSRVGSHHVDGAGKGERS
jgi:hypothetical protein